MTDLVLALANTVLVAGLLPLVLDRGAQVPRRTSVPTACALGVVAACQLDLGAPLGAGVAALMALGWGFVAWRRKTK